MRLSGIVVGSVGVAGIVTGVIFSLKAQSIANEVTADNAHHTYSRSKDDRGRRYSNLQWMGYTLGAALLADGGFLYYLGYREAHSPASDSLSFLPVLLPGGTGAVMQGSHGPQERLSGRVGLAAVWYCFLQVQPHGRPQQPDLPRRRWLPVGVPLCARRWPATRHLLCAGCGRRLFRVS
jgi:hypothetical protein